MYNFLKPLLKVVGYVPPEKVQTRVLKFSSFVDIGDPLYKAQYKKWGIWWNFIEAFDFFDHCPGLSSPYSSKTSKNFDELVEFCQQFKTYKDIKEYHIKDKQRYQSAEQRYRKKLKEDETSKEKSFRYWQSE